MSARTQESKQRRTNYRARPETRALERAYYSRHDIKEKQRLSNLRYTRRMGHKMLVRDAERRARKKAIDFSLPLEWADGATTCELTGIEFIKGDKMFAASIDRIDNSKGYTPDNCRLILRGLNVFKNDSTDEVMYTVAAALLNHRKDVQ